MSCKLLPPPVLCHTWRHHLQHPGATWRWCVAITSSDGFLSRCNTPCSSSVMPSQLQYLWCPSKLVDSSDTASNRQSWLCCSNQLRRPCQPDVTTQRPWCPRWRYHGWCQSTCRWDGAPGPTPLSPTGPMMSQYSTYSQHPSKSSSRNDLTSVII